MITLLLHLLRLLPVLCAGYRQLALENLALRQQLAMYKRMARRPKIRRTDRLFWGWLVRVWAGWKQSRPSGPVLAGRALIASAERLVLQSMLGDATQLRLPERT